MGEGPAPGRYIYARGREGINETTENKISKSNSRIKEKDDLKQEIISMDEDNRDREEEVQKNLDNKDKIKVAELEDSSGLEDELKIKSDVEEQVKFESTKSDQRKSSLKRDKPLLKSLNNFVVKQDLFRLPITSFLYERGWRDNFKNFGFPGIEEEFNEFMLLSAENSSELMSHTSVLDMSCGSGLMTRRLIKSKAFDTVIACDFSESMLVETYLRCKREKIENVPLLVRADVVRLPFPDESISFVHAGAALHCWPKPEDGLKEVYRIMKPGGKFMLTTFGKTAVLEGTIDQNVKQSMGARRTLRNVMKTFGGKPRSSGTNIINDIDLEDTQEEELAKAKNFRLFEVEEVKQMCLDAGFSEDKVEVVLVGSACIIAKMKK